MTCNADKPEVLGPILDGDEVIIGVTFEVGTTTEETAFGFLNVVSTTIDKEENNFYVLNGAGNFDPKTVPRFTINFLSDDPSGGNNPYVFFTLNNGKDVRASCGCTSGITNISFPGIGVTSYPQTSAAANYPSFSSSNPKVKFLYPGPAAPIQLIANDGTTPWFPLTNDPKEPRNGKYVLALSNVPYTMNAIVEGQKFDDVNIIASLVGVDIECTLGSGPGGCKKQIYYIIPTKFFESSSGSTLCKACEENSGEDAILGSFCSVGCGTFSKTSSPMFNFCCSGNCEISELDCTKVCKYGFTNKNDCTDKCFYDYCTLGKQCSGDCKSSCPSLTSICTLKGTTYTCIPLTIPGSGTGPNGNNDTVGLSSTEIIVIMIISVFVFGLIIYVIYAWGTEYNKPVE